MLSQRLQAAVLLTTCALGASCSGDPRPTRTVAPHTDLAPTRTEPEGARIQTIVSVTVTPFSSTINPGATVQLSAAAINQLGGVVADAMFSWSSSVPGIATVTASGLVTGVSAGTTTIAAKTLRNGTTGTATVTVSGPPPPGATLIAAGDIAVCNTNYDEATATVVDGIPGTVVLLGDNAYPSGTATDFANCYQPSWGRHKSRTRPAPGNHDWQTGAGAPYFSYFGASAGPAGQGWYSFNLGSWHIVSLNSNCLFVGCALGSPQDVWLRADLAATTQPCILAYWHHPRFSSGASHGNDVSVSNFWNALYQYHADIVLNGHSHIYERYGLQNPSAVADANGIRQITVGTGGKSPLHGWGAIQPNSQVRGNTSFGVLKLTLGSATYGWNFVPVAGSTWTDAGSGTCH